MLPTQRIPRLALAALALALVLRLAFVAATPGYVPGHDDRDYDRLACGLVAGKGYTRFGPVVSEDRCGEGPTGEPTAFRPPGYPMFLAAVYTATDPIGIERWTAARVAQALLGTVVVALLGLVAWQLFGRRTALAAMMLGAVFPPAIVLGGSLLSETLFVALMLGAIVAVLADRSRGGDKRWLVAAGVLCGLAALTRSNAPALLLPLAVAVAAAPPGPRRPIARVGRAAALVAVAALVVAPWTIRNAVELHGFAPVSTEAGSALAGTYNDTVRTDPNWAGAWRPPGHLPEFRTLLASVGGDEPAEQRELMQESLRYMADHPGYVAKVVGLDLARLSGLAGPDWWHFAGRPLSLPRWTADVSGAAFLVFLALALAGAFTRAARAAPRWVWAIPVLVLASVVVFVGETRLRAPIDPFVVLLAALALTRFLPAAQPRAARERAAAASA
jgi:4-amino-4-deoxy-L-arabinose transferase-like glycosyltransferase